MTFLLPNSLVLQMEIRQGSSDSKVSIYLMRVVIVRTKKGWHTPCSSMTSKIYVKWLLNSCMTPSLGSLLQKRNLPKKEISSVKKLHKLRKEKKSFKSKSHKSQGTSNMKKITMYSFLLMNRSRRCAKKHISHLIYFRKKIS